MPITADTFTKLADRLAADLSQACSSAPICARPAQVDPLDEADFDTIGLALAKIMATCAEYLEEAGFDTAEAEALAERAAAAYERKAKTRIQECRGCAAMPGESNDCTGRLDCEASR